MIDKFNKKEVEVKTGKTYPGFETWYGFPQTELYSEVRNFHVTPKENFELFKNRQPVYWVPSYLNDFNLVYPNVVPDNLAVSFEGGVDAFGVEWVIGSNKDLPSIVKPGEPKLKDILDWRNLEISDPDSWDWESSAKNFAGLDKDRPTLGLIVNSFFERLIALMDFMYAAMAMIEEPEEVAAFMERCADHNIKLIEHYKKAYNVDAILFHDDWGAQRAPFFSHDCVRETMLSAVKRMVTRAHELDIFVIHHNCGNVEGFLPEMIEEGSDCIQVQINANPNIYETMEKYKDKMMFDMVFEVGEQVSDEEFRKMAISNFELMSKHKNAIVDMVDKETWMATPTQKDILYELARKSASGEAIE